MKRSAKKFLTLLLSAIMAFSGILPAFAATVESTDDVIVYIKGYGCTIYKDNIPTEENIIFPKPIDIGEILSNSLSPILSELAQGLITNDYDEYCDEIYNAVEPLFKDCLLDSNGEASDGSGWGGDALTDEFIVSDVNTPENSIIFPYDWRLSPQHNAEILEKFIDRVCREKGVNQVDLMGRCLGMSVVNAYLENGKNLNKVDDVVMYIPGTMGMYVLGALFSGNIDLDSDNINTFLDYYLTNNVVIEDPGMNSFVIAYVNFLNQARALGIASEFLEKALKNIIDDLFPRIIRATYGTFPAFWSMIPDKYFESAINFTFNTPALKKEFAGLIAKARDFHDNVQLTCYDTMTRLRDGGMRFMIVSKYDTPVVPLGPEADYNGDFYAETELSSFGATCALYGETLSEEHINSLNPIERSFVSPDNKIDASTCLFPETTWFIKYCLHDHWPEPQDAMAMQFLRDKNMTVFTYDEYPQYLKLTDFVAGGDKTSGVMSPVEGPDPVEDEDEGFVSGYISFLKKMFSSIRTYFANLIKRFFPNFGR